MSLEQGRDHNPICVFITSCETHDKAWRNQEFKLKEFSAFSNCRYKIVENPESADIILVGNVRDENWGEILLHNQLINQFPDKAFSLSEHDGALYLHHGIYTSGRKSILGFGRIRTGSYALFPDEYVNPFIKAFNPSSEIQHTKEYLFSFIGRISNPIREKLFHITFTRKDILLEDSSLHYDLWAENQAITKDDRQFYYYEVLLKSKFSLCPRGAVPNSFRLFETMKLGTAPVIIADHFNLPKGPNWKDFSIFIKEKHINNVEEIISSHEDDYRAMGVQAHKAYEDYFSESKYFDYVIANCLDIKKNQLIPERIYWKFRKLVVIFLQLSQRISWKLDRIKSLWSRI